MLFFELINLILISLLIDIEKTQIGITNNKSEVIFFMNKSSYFLPNPPNKPLNTFNVFSITPELLIGNFK